MDVTQMLASIDGEIAKLQRAKDTMAALQRPVAGKRMSLPGSEDSKGSVSPKEKQKRKMTAEGSARIAAAQKKRWAKRNQAQHEGETPSS